MKRVAESFTWPFRARISTWIWGSVMVFLLPVLFVPLLGYAVAATRSAELFPAKGPPPFRLSGPLVWAGAWTSVVVILTLAPFAFALQPLASSFDRLVGEPYAGVTAFFVLALGWGVVVLLLIPHAAASFAASGVYTDLFDVAGSLRGVRREFATWNAVVAAMVTAWAIGLACAGLLCVGIVPGVFYAILVSAHAAAALHTESSSQSPRAG